MSAYMASTHLVFAVPAHSEFDFYSWRFNLVCADSDFYFYVLDDVSRPDMTSAVDWALKCQLYIYLSRLIQLHFPQFRQSSTVDCVLSSDQNFYLR